MAGEEKSMPKMEWEVVSEKTYQAIGHFIFEFSQVEYAIRYYLAEEIKLDSKYFSPIVESYDVGLLCTVAIHVFNQSRDGANGAKIVKLIKRFAGLNDERKRVVHGLWVPFMDGGMVHYVPRGSLKPNQVSKQAAALEQRALELNALRFELENAFYRLGGGP
jgi:hypothetical protein